jgi:hypothetical protein
MSRVYRPGETAIHPHGTGLPSFSKVSFKTEKSLSGGVEVVVQLVAPSIKINDTKTSVPNSYFTISKRTVPNSYIVRTSMRQVPQ